MRLSKQQQRILAVLAHTARKRLDPEFLVCCTLGVPPRDEPDYRTPLSNAQRTSYCRSLRRLIDNKLVTRWPNRIACLTKKGQQIAETLPYDSQWNSTLNERQCRYWFSSTEEETALKAHAAVNVNLRRRFLGKR